MSDRETSQRIEALLEEMRVIDVNIRVDRRFQEDLVVALGPQGLARWVVWLLKWSRDPENRTPFDENQEPDGDADDRDWSR